MRTWRVVVIAVIMAIQGIAPFLLLVGHHAVVTERWIGYAIPTLAVSAALSIVFVFSLPQTIYVMTFLTQWLLLYVVGLPLGDSITLEILVSVTLIVELSLFAHPSASLPTALGAVAFLALQQGPTDAWSIALPGVPPGDIVGYIVVTAGALGLATSAHVLIARVATIHAVSAEKDTVIQRLVNANMEYQRYALEVEQSTVRAERDRISREIHDTIGYAFTNQRMMLEASTVLFDRDHTRLKELIAQAQASLSEGYQHVRLALRELRSVGTSVPSLNARIHELTRQFSDVSGVEVRYDAVGI
ncbi:MAG: sensor histidine kinase, partial [Alkalispirochaeta sp.]